MEHRFCLQITVLPTNTIPTIPLCNAAQANVFTCGKTHPAEPHSPNSGYTRSHRQVDQHTRVSSAPILVLLAFPPWSSLESAGQRTPSTPHRGSQDAFHGTPVPPGRSEDGERGIDFLQLSQSGCFRGMQVEFVGGLSGVFQFVGLDGGGGRDCRRSASVMTSTQGTLSAGVIDYSPVTAVLPVLYHPTPGKA